MNKGKVKWFNTTKGYGFITPEDNASSGDVFVHISAVQQAGLNTLTEGQVIHYEIAENKGKKSAVNLEFEEAS